MKSPKISVIVPIYNTEGFLRPCVDSILAQTYTNLEVILVDDGSCDGSPAICDAYARQDKRIRVIHKENGGLSSARNAGLDAATGDHVGFVDSDDVIAPTMYQNLVDAACNSEENMVVLTSASYMDEDGKRISPLPLGAEKGLMTSREFLSHLFTERISCSVCAGLFPSEMIKYLRFPEGILNEDFVWWMRLLPMIDRIGFFPMADYFYRIRTSSISRSGFSKSIIDSVDNTNIARELIKRAFPEVEQECLRYYLSRRLVYMRWIPMDMMKKDNSHYCKTLEEIRRERAHISKNPCLRKVEKFSLQLVCAAPKVFKILCIIREPFVLRFRVWKIRIHSKPMKEFEVETTA